MDTPSLGEPDLDQSDDLFRAGIDAYQTVLALVTAHRSGDLTAEVDLVELAAQPPNAPLIVASFTALVSELLNRLDTPVPVGGGDRHLRNLAYQTALLSIADRAEASKRR